MANPCPRRGESSSPNGSEIQGAVTIATPHNHGDGKAEHGCKGRPTQGEQHGLDQINGEILPSVLRLLPQ